MTFDDQTIMAYVDGECDAVTAKRLEKAMQSDQALADRVASEQALRTKLAAHYNPVAEEAVPDHLTALLEASASNNVDDSFAARKSERQDAKQRRAGMGFAQWGAMAATLAIGVVVGQFGLGGQNDTPLAQDGGALIASGPLENALDKQLASMQTDNDEYRIGLTFRAQTGNICRSFEGEALSGIACREGSQWQMYNMLPGGTSADYRQASSGEINAIAAEMMADVPADADAERQWRESGWK
tara:strand:- start:1371 stop:2096 length:726 start_codon:yes stop_codon:yes gene_type:complete